MKFSSKGFASRPHRPCQAVVWLWASFLLALGFASGLRAAAGPPPPPPAVQKLFDMGSYRSAVASLDADVAAAPSDASLHYWLGRCFYELHDYSEAVSDFERAISIDPNLSAYHDWLGRASGRKAEESRIFGALASLALARRVEHEFTTAVNLDAANIDAQRDLIRFLINAPGIVGGSEDRAQKQIQDLAVVDPVQAQLASAEVLAVHKQFDEAGAKYRQILASKPRSVSAYLEIAAYYRDRGDAAHLQQTIDAAAAVAPNDPRLLFYRGVALIMQKQDPARAEDDLRKYLAAIPDNSEDPSHASAHDWLGQLYVNEGRPDQAVAEYRAEVALDPRNKTAREALSRLEKRR